MTRFEHIKTNIGFEMNEEYFQIADKRIKEAQEDWKDRSGEFWKV